MRRIRIEKRRRSGRTGRTTDDTFALDYLRDPRDADIVRAKRASRAQRDGIQRP